MAADIRQGEIWQADLCPVKGGEPTAIRSIVVLSGNLLNEYLEVIIAAPLTTEIKNYKGNPVLKPTPANGLKNESEMLVFQIRSISKDRLVKKIGTIHPEELALAAKTLNELLKY